MDAFGDQVRDKCEGQILGEQTRAGHPISIFYRPHCSPGYMMPVAFPAGCTWADHFTTNPKQR